MKLNNGSVELLKWIAVLAMTGDHINKYLFNGTLPYLFEIGRVALPMFVFVLAYNLNRHEALSSACAKRVLTRLCIFGAISTIPFVILGGLEHGWWPLNVLFTLFSLAAVIYSIERNRKLFYLLAVCIFITAGAVVEFGWVALALGVTCWSAIRYKSILLATLAILFCAGLMTINGNYWALAALPLISIAAVININLPRMKTFFYFYYPIHLTLLLLIRIPMAKAGYFFIGV